MKDLKFIAVQPDDTYYVWQVHMWLESLRELGMSDKAIVLVFIPGFRERNVKWDQVIALYPESEFVFYKDDAGEITPLLGTYIPVLRPWTLEKYFTEHPEMKDKAIFYCDSDTVFTEKFDIQRFIDDDVCYLSDTNSYINASYFDSKIKDVLPNKLEEYKKIDVLDDLSKIIGISRQIAEKNNVNSGGAQYLLKNVDGEFWGDVKRDCIIIRKYLMGINKTYFASENRGFQSWCADMWAVLWNLWKRNIETKNIPEMDFSWASDHIERVKKLPIFHNAGIVGDNMGDHLAFYKGKYHQGKDPFTDMVHLNAVINHPISKTRGTHYYLTRLLKLKQKYNLNY
jgi:hypothetical protein